tara:strand:- start:3086 stop:3943 length:858 start_codon:yes stop_codon:yes gene_type:complete
MDYASLKRIRPWLGLVLLVVLLTSIVFRREKYRPSLQTTKIAIFEHPIKVLLVSAVSGDVRSINLWRKNLQNMAKNIDVFFCFYGDITNELANTKVVGTIYGSGCKAEHWYNVPMELIRKYTHLWLCDEDIEITNFDWKSFERIMIEKKAVVIQPSIKAAKGVTRSTDIDHLRYKPNGRVKEVPRTEVQSCLVSTKIWPILYERLKKSDRRSVWGLDTCWDDIARLLNSYDTGTPPPIVTQHLYVEHHDFRSMNNGACTRHCIDNCKPLSETEVSKCKSLLNIKL